MEYRLIAQGNANLIYNRSDGVTIRVSKTGTDPRLVVAYWQSMWQPKLGDYMHPLRVIADPRFGWVIEVVYVGISPHCEIIGEFKPKWLLQSPRAPANARSCRTCAIKQMRNQPNSFCCLDIGCLENISPLASAIAAKPEHANLIESALSTSQLLVDLKFWQAKLSRNSRDLRDCMSLRDCTVLIEHNHLENKTQLWIVDLDPKLGAEKTRKWEQLEHQLHPYYLARSPVCRLSR